MTMETRSVIPPYVFEAVDHLDIDSLSKLHEEELRPLLPSLVRMSLCSPLDQGKAWTRKRRSILRLLCGIEAVNSLVALLSIDFHVLEQDAKKELVLRSKAGSSNQPKESNLLTGGSASGALEFERSEAAGKLRLVLSEILLVVSKLRATAAEAALAVPSETHSEFYWRDSELFEDGIYLEEVADVLCIAQAELPNLLQISELTEALLHVPNGDWLVCRLVVNNAEAFNEVCHSLIAGGGGGSGDTSEDDVDTRKRCEVLSALVRMNPRQALCVRTLAVNMCRLPPLSIALTLEHNLGGDKSGDAVNFHLPNDLLEFSSGLLLNVDPNKRCWFSQFLRNEQKRKSGASYEASSSHMVKEFRSNLLSQLGLILDRPVPTRSTEPVVLDDDRLTPANSFVRLFSALKGIASLKFNEEEAMMLVTLLTSRPTPTPLGTRFICLSLSMTIACPGLFSNSEDERRVAAWLQWLMEVAPRFEGSGSGGGFGEMLLLIAIHFHGNQMTAITDLVCATLGMKVPVRSNALVRLKSIFTQEIFSEKVVTSLAVSVPVTRRLSAVHSGFLSVHCIHQLLKSRAFAKHKVPIKDWICRQLRECRAPLHPVVPNLVEAFVNSTLIPSRQAAQNTNEPLTHEEVMTFFSFSPLGEKLDTKMEADGQVNNYVSSEEVVPQMLLLYYMLLYEDVRMSQMKAISTGSRNFLTYSSDLWAELPIKYLLRLGHRDQQNFSGLYSSLLRLVANHFPHLCLVDDWLTEEEKFSNQRATSDPSINADVPGLPAWVRTISAESLEKSFRTGYESKMWTTLMVTLTRISFLDADAIIPLASTLTSNLWRLLPVAEENGNLSSQPPRKILDLTNAIWLKLSAVMPRRLHVMTVNGLHNLGYASSLESSLEPVYNQTDIVTDPLIVLRCDERVFRCPPLLDITLRILNGCLQASKAMLSKHIRLYPSGASSETRPISGMNGTLACDGPSDAEREELRFALVAAQDSAAAQILLEWCLPTADEKFSSFVSPLREVRCLVSSWLHQMFIADPTLAKLLHFQGYPLELLHVTVTGVPSMHICIDFIPELLRQPQIDKQVFAIQLVSYLSLQYPLPRTLSMARLTVNVMSTLLTVLPRHQRIPFFLITTPSLARISRAFAPLTDDVTLLLLQLGRICNASIAKCSYMAAGLLSPTKKLKQDIVPTTERLVSFDTSKQYSTLDAAEVGLMEMVKDVFERVVSVAALIRVE